MNLIQFFKQFLNQESCNGTSRLDLGYRYEKFNLKNEVKYAIKSLKNNGDVVTIGASYNF